MYWTAKSGFFAMREFNDCLSLRNALTLNLQVRILFAQGMHQRLSCRELTKPQRLSDHVGRSNWPIEQRFENCLCLRLLTVLHRDLIQQPGSLQLGTKHILLRSLSDPVSRLRGLLHLFGGFLVALQNRDDLLGSRPVGNTPPSNV